MNKLNKFSRATIAIAIMFCVALPTFAHDFEYKGIYYDITNSTNTTVKVTYKGSSYNSSSNEYAGAVTIPSSVVSNFLTTCSVTSIGDDAFRDCDGLTSITIPNSVTSISNYAFSDCTGLTSITIPNSVTSIGDYAFRDCTGLTEVNISDLSAWCKIDFGNYYANPLYYAKKLKLNGVEIRDLVIPNEIAEIKDYAFYNCSGLTSVTIPNSVTSIGDYAFRDCTGLNEVNFNAENCTSMGSLSSYLAFPVFSGCSNLKTVNIGSSVKTIPSYAFYGCTGLTSITIPNSVTTIGASAFRGCSGLTEVTIPNSVTSIGEYAFEGCDDLTEVNITDLSAWCKIDFGNKTANPLYYAKKLKLNGSEITNLVIPNDITEIKDYAFSRCRGLTSVTIPNSVTSIGDYTFSYCSSLTSVTIGNSVTSIGDKAFEVCTGLKTIVSLNPTPPVCANSDSFYNNLYSSATLYVPKDSYAKYFIDDVWGQFTNIKKIETTATSITLNNSSIELDKGNTATLSATIAPSNATIKNIVWTSSNPQIATVDQSGKVTALTPGTATITAKSIDGSNVSASCKVTVNRIIPTITLSQIEATLPVNEIMTLSYSITNSATKTATWSTSNEYVAYVKTNSDGSATIVGMADGVATITATMVDNGQEYSASCVVTVGVGGVEEVEIDNNAIEIARYDIHGHLLTQPTPGINIVKMSNGTTRKEIVK